MKTKTIYAAIEVPIKLGAFPLSELIIRAYQSNMEFRILDQAAPLAVETFDEWIAKQFWAECFVDDLPNFRRVWDAAKAATQPKPASAPLAVDMQTLQDVYRLGFECHSFAVSADSPYYLKKMADDLAPYATQPQPAVELRRERDLLAAAIGNAAVKAGICRADADLTGPHLLMLANDMADCIPQPAVAVPQGVSDEILIAVERPSCLSSVDQIEVIATHVCGPYKLKHRILATPPEAKVGNRTRLVDDTETSIDRLAWDDGLPPSSEAKKR